MHLHLCCCCYSSYSPPRAAFALLQFRADRPRVPFPRIEPRLVPPPSLSRHSRHRAHHPIVPGIHPRQPRQHGRNKRGVPRRVPRIRRRSSARERDARNRPRPPRPDTLPENVLVASVALVRRARRAAEDIPRGAAPVAAAVAGVFSPPARRDGGVFPREPREQGFAGVLSRASTRPRALELGVQLESERVDEIRAGGAPAFVIRKQGQPSGRARRDADPRQSPKEMLALVPLGFASARARDEIRRAFRPRAFANPREGRVREVVAIVVMESVAGAAIPRAEFSRRKRIVFVVRRVQEIFAFDSRGGELVVFLRVPAGASIVRLHPRLQLAKRVVASPTEPEPEAGSGPRPSPGIVGGVLAREAAMARSAARADAAAAAACAAAAPNASAYAASSTASPSESSGDHARVGSEFESASAAASESESAAASASDASNARERSGNISLSRAFPNRPAASNASPSALAATIAASTVARRSRYRSRMRSKSSSMRRARHAAASGEEGWDPRVLMVLRVPRVPTEPSSVRTLAAAFAFEDALRRPSAGSTDVGFGFVVAGIDVRARGGADDGRGGLFLECIHILRRGARGRRARREGSPSGVPADAQRLGGITDVSLVVIALVGRGEGKGTRRPANMAALRVREMWGRGRARAARARRRAQRRTHQPERRAVRGGRVSTGRFRRLTG